MIHKREMLILRRYAMLVGKPPFQANDVDSIYKYVELNFRNQNENSNFRAGKSATIHLHGLKRCL